MKNKQFIGAFILDVYLFNLDTNVRFGSKADA